MGSGLSVSIMIFLTMFVDMFCSASEDQDSVHRKAFEY